MPGVSAERRAGPEANGRETGAADPPVLEIRGAVLRAGPRTVLAGIDLGVGRGELVALLGPNGAGKTSLIRAVTGRVSLDAGSIRILGRDLATDPAARRLTGVVPQSVALYQHLTARENLEVFGRLSGVPAAEVDGRAAAALAEIGLTDRARHRTATLSGGMQRRLNIAAGTLHRPPLLLLDEPTVGVDVGAREAVHDLLRGVRRAGTAVLLTTHDLHEAAALADRVVILHAGRVLASDSPAALVARQFAGDKELVVTVRNPRDPACVTALEAAGLRPINQGGQWSGRLPGGWDRVPAVGERLQSRGVVVEALHVREPDLRSVFVALTGTGFDE